MNCKWGVATQRADLLNPELMAGVLGIATKDHEQCCLAFYIFIISYLTSIEHYCSESRRSTYTMQ
uniref:Uncharacterized protein n=1 Tax=Anguilla anguilla TaxID=7936 RepID=A0A0E9RJL6_ANGAN